MTTAVKVKLFFQPFKLHKSRKSAHKTTDVAPFMTITHPFQSPSLFDWTVRDTDEEFYATFPEARDALTRSFTGDNTLNDVPLSQQLSYYQQEYSWTNPEFSSVSPLTSVQQLEGLLVLQASNTHSTSTFPNHDNSLPSCHQIPQPQASGDYDFSYQQQYLDLAFPVISQSSFDSVPLSASILSTPHNVAGPSASKVTDLPGSVASIDQIPSRDTSIPPIRQGCKLRPALGSSNSSIRLSQCQLEKKQLPVACLFCRGRKIACQPPLPGKTCE